MLIASVLSLAFALPQNPWIVDSAGGAGANFTDLPAAVAAAAHGDTILVRGATGPYQYYSYSGFAVSGKALTIRGDRSLATYCNAAAIDSVPPGSVFTLDGMAFGSVSVTLSNVALVHCATGGLQIANGAHVAVAQSQCGGTPAVTIGGLSTLVARRTSFAAPDYSNSTNPNCISHHSSEAIRAVDANVILYDCQAAGGFSLFYMSAGGFGGCLSAFTWHESGITLSRSNLRVAGSATRLSGLFEIAADSASHGILHGDVPALLGPVPAGIVTSAAVLPDLSVSGTTVPNGEILTTSPVTVTLRGSNAGAPVLIAFAATPPVADNSLAPLALGEIMLPVSQYFLAANLDGTGQFSVTFPGILVPWIGTAVFGQAAELDVAAGQFLMSNLELHVFKN